MYYSIALRDAFPQVQIVNKLQVTTNRSVYKYNTSHVNKNLCIYIYENMQF